MPGLNSTTLEQLAGYNDYYFNYRIPALIFLGLMAPLGIVGNASVIYIYGFRLKKSNVHLFITLLAVSDIISCLVGIPMEMYRMVLFYNYPSIAACKVEGFVTFACYVCSALMLLTISVERYVKVCRSMGTQVSRKMAKILSGGVFLFSSVYAIPLPVFSEPHAYLLKDGTVVQDCNFHIEPELWYYVVGYFVVLLSVLVSMFLLYWRVLKTARSHVTWTLQRRAQSSVEAIVDAAAQTSKPETETKKLSQTNRTVIWISGVYATSCVPIFTIAMVTKLFTHLNAPHPIDYLVFILYQSWILNCTLNPVVYGFLNSKFRSEFRILLNVVLEKTSFSSVEKSGESNQTGSSTTR